MNRFAHKLAEMFRNTGAFREGDFVLSSGKPSPYYVDGKLVTLHPQGLVVAADAVLEELRGYEVQAVGGPEVGGIPVATAVVMRAAQLGGDLPGFFVRKEPKPHGLRKRIEGQLEPGANVAIVDDVITSGQSVLNAVRSVQEEGYKVLVVVGLVDRQEGATELMAQQGIPYKYILTVEQLRSMDGATTTV